MKRQKTVGFGYDPATSPHHFVVEIRRNGTVLISERFESDDVEDATSPDVVLREPQLKAELDEYHWTRVADAVQEDFNKRLRAVGSGTGRWNRSQTQLAAHFGKELVLLAWAIEECDPTLLPNILANWQGLAPEERWWLYTTINATFTGVHEPQRGWRKAIKIAFGENPVDVLPSAFLSSSLPISDEDRNSATASRRRGPRRTQQKQPTSQISFDLPMMEEPQTSDPERDEEEESDSR